MSLSKPPPHQGLVVTGLLAAAAAAVATTVAAALARAAGVDFVVDGGEAIPVSGVGVLTAGFSLVGVALAAALRRWSARPARRFAVTACALTGLSLVPPFLVGADAATAVTLVLLHLLAAVVVVPVLTRALAGKSG